jgi:5-methylcytosine-specific restriction endonuclease McrA
MAVSPRCIDCGEPVHKWANRTRWPKRCRGCQAIYRTQYEREYQRKRKGLSAHEHTVKCDGCGGIFSTSYARARWCSARCAQAYKNAAVAAELLAAKAGRLCGHCEGQIPASRPANAAFCSPECCVKARNLYAKLAGRADRPKQRAIRGEIIRRDNETCQLCEMPVDLKLGYPDPMSASLDHVVPLARGGDNAVENLQLAHLQCNLRKGKG